MAEESLQRFLESFAKAESRSRAARPGLRPFVTISRQAGSGGRLLGDAIRRRLERDGAEPWAAWKVFDRELCLQLAEDPELRVSLESLVKEEYASPLGDLAQQVLADATPQEIVWRRLFATMRRLAAAGRSIIIGRAGCLVTRNLPGGVHLRLVAPFETRARRMTEALALDRDGGERWCVEQEAARARLFKSRFRKDIDDPLLYDAVFDASRSSFEEIAAAVVGLLKARAERLAAGTQAPALSGR